MELASYNTAAATDPEAAYGHPWQIIYVFDNDPTTKVVCEGYSKAFKYLCDLSTFLNPNISCYLVTGTMNGGNHMWNIVTMKDGKNYLVDVTNSEDGTFGAGGELFLTGASGNISIGYTVYSSNGQVKYVYDDRTKDLWGTSSSSILSVASSDYVPVADVIYVTMPDEIYYSGNALTAGHRSAGTFDISYIIDGNNDEYTFIYSWHSDNDGGMGDQIANPPQNAETYYIQILARNKTVMTDIITTVKKVEIKKVTPEVTVTASDITESGKTLNDANLTIVAKDKSGNIIDGIYYFIDNDGNALDITTSVVEAAFYKWKFIPTDIVNYESKEGVIVLWHRYHKVTLSIGDKSQGTLSGGGNYDENTTATVKATPKYGYEFLGWSINGQIVSRDAEYTFTVTEDITLEAIFNAVDVFDANDVVQIMWYVLYALIAIGVIGTIIVFVKRD